MTKITIVNEGGMGPDERHEWTSFDEAKQSGIFNKYIPTYISEKRFNSVKTIKGLVGLAPDIFTIINVVKYTTKEEVYRKEIWCNSQGIFVTGDYDEFDEVLRRNGLDQWERVRFYYASLEYEVSGSDYNTENVIDVMKEQGFEDHEIEEIISTENMNFKKGIKM